MNKILFRTTLCTLLTVVVMTAASAQWSQNDRSRWGIGMSIFFPSNNNVEKATGSSWFGPTVDYNLKFNEQDKPISVITGGFLNKDGAADGFNGSVIPVSYTAFKRYEGKYSGWYTGTGAGVYFGKFEPNQFAGTSESKSSTKFGLHVVGGREFGKGAFAEMRYDITTEGNDDLSFTGLSMNAGMRQTF